MLLNQKYYLLFSKSILTLSPVTVLILKIPDVCYTDHDNYNV